MDDDLLQEKMPESWQRATNPSKKETIHAIFTLRQMLEKYEMTGGNCTMCIKKDDMVGLEWDGKRNNGHYRKY